jgi:hypothetical protein
VVKKFLEVEGCRNSILFLGESVSKASLLALVSASLFFADPALAFKVSHV